MAKTLDGWKGKRIIGLAALSLSLMFADSPGPGAMALVRDSVVAGSQARSQRRPRSRAAARASAKPKIDYTNFSHVTHVEQQKLSCDSCHKFPSKNWDKVRKPDVAFPDVSDFPEHASCLDCHREQFFARERPAPAICSNCHVKVSPRDTTRFLFPSLGDVTDPILKRRDLVSEFSVNFPHETHVDLVGENRTRRQADGRFRFAVVAYSGAGAQDEEPKSCPVCHQTYQPQGDSPDEYVTKPPKDLGDGFWLKKGSFKTIPNNHGTCFTCHSTDSGIAPLPSDCHVCHKVKLKQADVKTDFDATAAKTMGISDKVILKAWARRISSATFTHDGGLHPAASCLNCHKVATMNTVDLKTLKVQVSSCGGAEGCHITATIDEGGALNYEIDQRKTSATFKCTKCHLAFGKESLPENHVKAIPAGVVGASR